MSLDPPYRLDRGQLVFRFIGWTEVDDPEAPKVRLTLNGVEVPVVLTDRPDVAAAFPGAKTRGCYAEVDFRQVLKALPVDGIAEPFLLQAVLTSDHRRRTFEYAVTDDWLEAVFERPLKARRGGRRLWPGRDRPDAPQPKVIHRRRTTHGSDREQISNQKETETFP